MAIEIPIVVPHESVNDETVKLVRWLVIEGQSVAAGDEVAEVEGSKATFPVLAPEAGIVHLLARIDDEVPVGSPLCFLALADDQKSADPPISLNGPANALPSPSATLPVRPVQATADPASPVAVLASVSHKPSSQRFSQRAKELLKEHNLSEDRFSNLSLVREADVLTALGRETGRLRDNGSGGPGDWGTGGPGDWGTGGLGDRGNDERGERGEGSGASAQISPPVPQSPSPPVSQSPSPPVPTVATEYDNVPLSRQKQTEIRYLRKGLADSVPSQVSLLIPTKGLREALIRDDAAVSLTSLIAFECSRLLRRYSDLNGFYHEQSACRYRNVNIGFAVAGEFGLKVLVIRNTDQKPLTAVSEETRDLLAAYAQNTLTPDQLNGGTFTISDLSGEGVFALTPLIVQNQSAILGIGAETWLGSEGLFTLSLSFDHQMADGLTAAKFLSELGSRLRHHEATLHQEAKLRKSAPTLVCTQCGRGSEDLTSLHGYLLQTISQDGTTVLVCTFCIAGF